MRKACLILCVVALLFTAGAVLGCGGDGDGRSPSDVVRAYIQAAKDLDIDTIYDLMSSENKDFISKDDLREMATEDLEALDIDYAIGEEAIEGDQATVGVTLTITERATGESEEVPSMFFLEKEDGEWKVSFGGI